MAAPALTLLHHAFAQPWGLVLVALLPLLALPALLAWRWRRQALARLGTTYALRGLLVEQPVLRRLRSVCWALGFVVLALGVAGPQWGRDWSQPAAPGRDVVVVLDLSRSMLAESPSRLERAKAALVDLSRDMQRRGGHRLALVVFAGRARLVCPLTHDYDHFRDALEPLNAAAPPPDVWPLPGTESGTRIGEGIRLAVQTHDPHFQGAQDILLLSDGDDPARDEEWRPAAEEARQQHIPVHTIGLGSPTEESPIPYRGGEQLYEGKVVHTRLEEKPLQEIARITRATYTAAHTGPLPLGRIFQERLESQEVREDSTDALPAYRQRYPWFLGAALLFLAAEMTLGSRKCPLNLPASSPSQLPRSQPNLVLLPLVLGMGSLLGNWDGRASPAGASSTPEELLRRGNAAFEREDYAAALDLYTRAEDASTDPGFVAFNKAAALYRQASQAANAAARPALYREAELNYRRCLEDAVGSRRSAALLGLGNSLLQQGTGRPAVLQEAVQAYSECLGLKETPPELAEGVRHNLELAKLLWQQARTAGKKKPPDEPADTEDPMKKSPSKSNGSEDGNREPAPGRASPTGEKMRVPQASGETPIPTQEERPPGAGNLPPVPDTAELVPMPAEDAAVHLRQAVARILRERREHQQHTARPLSSTVKDW